MNGVMEKFFDDGPVDIRVKNFRANVEATEKFMFSLPQITVEPVHRFAPGLYCRQLTMPADTIWMSKTHKHEHFAFIMSGSCTVVSENGRETLFAPFMMKTQAGTKRLLLIHEECTWITVHAVPPEMDSAEDVEEIEEHLACNTPADFENYMLEKREVIS
jgi:quercetin dioxygenase-like cupin family protein